MAPKIIMPLRSQQALAFGFFRTGLTMTVTGTHADDTFTCAGHGLNNGDAVIFLGLTNGYGLTAGTVRYYVINKTANTFQVSLTPGGSAVNFTTNVTTGTFRLSTLAETVTGWDGGKVVVKYKPETSVLLLNTEVTGSGSGATTRYTAEWTSVTCDSAAARTFLEGQTTPRQCICELEWTDDEGTHRVSFPIKLAPAFNEDDDGAPDPLDSEALDWLAGHALRFDAPQTLSGDQIAQALENLGITIGEDGKLTFHTGHSIYLDAPP